MRQSRDHESQARAGVLLVRARLCDFRFGGSPLLPVPDTVLLRRVLRRGALLCRVRAQGGDEQGTLVLKLEGFGEYYIIIHWLEVYFQLEKVTTTLLRMQRFLFPTINTLNTENKTKLIQVVEFFFNFKL